MLKSVEWRNEVSSRSSAPATSRSSQVPLTFPLRQTRSGPFTPSQVLCCVVPEMWGTEGSLELSRKPLTSSSLLPRLTLLAGLPLFSFLKHVLTNVPLL